ncbi:hypothetical protein [Paenibacillus flagellatus]|uniref:Uncharacterized protein n=1 Tax=Paenibacillus flagellatus TaxID=2211139 RepID=A0A2V5JW16_9BACL|nr:hypothetical protein [Paenibacillus flagellatus]PYI50731.1 hypothetical protein DLM86_28630 [Paenibacillus flagellatus]
MVAIITESVKLLFGTLEFFSIVMLSFSLFRLPIRYSVWKIAVVSVVVTLISLYQRDYVGVGETAVLAMIVAYILLVSFLFNIQLMFAAVICMFGYLAYAVIQPLLAILIIATGWTTFEEMQASLFQGSLLQAVSSLVVLGIVFWMTRRKLGFMFIQKRITFSSSTRAYNLFLLSLLLAGIGAIQLTVISFAENTNILAVLAAVLLISVVGLVVTYKKNKREINEKYDRLKSRQH